MEARVKPREGSVQPWNQLPVAVEGKEASAALSVANDTKEDACVLAASKSRKGGGEGEQTCLPPELLGIENWNKEAPKFLLAPRSVFLGAVTEGKKS
jgi:hypothetical protein